MQSMMKSVCAVVMLSVVGLGQTTFAHNVSEVARARAGELMANIEQFELELRPNLAQFEKPFYALHLITSATAARNPQNNFEREVQVTRQQAGGIIGHLAASGLLDRAEEQAHPSSGKAKRPEGYILEVFCPKDRPVSFVVPLGWDLAMLKQLDGLRPVLEGKAAESMDRLLDRMSGLRQQWQQEAAGPGVPAAIGNAAREWCVALFAGNTKRVLELSAVPISWDGKEIVATLDELRVRLDAIVKQEGSRELPVKIGPALSSADAAMVVNDRFLGDKANVTAVQIMIKDERVLVFVRVGDEVKVVGFKD